MSATTATAGPRPYVKVRTEVLAANATASGFTHRELAMKAKLKSHATITNLTTGNRKTCSPDTATRLAKALKMPGSSLFEVVA